MRSIPAKRICLLGMNMSNSLADQTNSLSTFSSANPAGATAIDEDKQYFLETLLSHETGCSSATRHSPVNENPKEPSNVVSLLMDYLDTASAHLDVSSSEAQKAILRS